MQSIFMPNLSGSRSLNGHSTVPVEPVHGVCRSTKIRIAVLCVGCSNEDKVGLQCANLFVQAQRSFNPCGGTIVQVTVLLTCG